MGIVTGIVTYLVIWWVVIFMVLPFGVKGQWEEGGVQKGNDPGAPVAPRLRRKILITTAITTVLWAIVAVVLITGVITIDDLPAPFEIPEI